MAETDCRPQVQACAIRVARLDTDGTPLAGLTGMYVSDALVTATFTPVYTDGDEIEDKNACGVVGVNFRGDDTFKRGDFSLQIITPDPFLSEMLSGGELLDVPGLPAGFQAPPIGAVTGNGVSIELWSKRIDDGDLDADFPYAHWAYPKLRNLRMQPHTHANASLQPAFSGQSVENANWYDGPAGDWPADSSRCYQWVPAATLPTPSCAYQELVAS